MKAQFGIIGVLLWGCGAGTGAVSVTAYGEDFIEQQIPAASGEGEGFVDGYSVRFTKFLVAVSELSVRSTDGALGAQMSEQRIMDLKQPGPHRITEFEFVEARRWEDVGAAVRPAASAIAGNASDSDVALMNDFGYSIYFEGQGEKDGAQTRFAWGFRTHTDYRLCRDEDEMSGVLVPGGGAVVAQLTFHGDHFFYDDLLSETPSLRFEAIAAADANLDGETTIEELAMVDLSDLPADQYGAGGATDIFDLAAFEAALSQTLVHFQGEGHCEQSAR